MKVIITKAKVKEKIFLQKQKQMRM